MDTLHEKIINAISKTPSIDKYMLNGEKGHSPTTVYQFRHNDKHLKLSYSKNGSSKYSIECNNTRLGSVERDIIEPILQTAMERIKQKLISEL